MRSIPEPLPSSALSVTVVAALCQPPQPPLQVAVVVGAIVSAVTVKLVGAEVRPALFVAVTLFGSVGSSAPEAKVYAPLVTLHPRPNDGYAYEATPDSASVELAATENPPALPGL